MMKNLRYPANGRKAVFLDKDGTVIQNIPYNVNLELIELAPGVAEGVRMMHEAGFKLIVVTNQSGVARGYYTEEELNAVGEHLGCLFAEAGAHLTGFYFCPHLPDGLLPDFSFECQCRKPEPGLLINAAREHGIDTTQSWLVGDILGDVEAGRRAGCRTVLLDVGSEDEWVLSPQRLPHHIVSDMTEAAQVITAVSQSEVGI